MKKVLSVFMLLALTFTGCNKKAKDPESTDIFKSNCKVQWILPEYKSGTDENYSLSKFKGSVASSEEKMFEAIQLKPAENATYKYTNIGFTIQNHGVMYFTAILTKGTNSAWLGGEVVERTERFYASSDGMNFDINFDVDITLTNHWLTIIILTYISATSQYEINDEYANQGNWWKIGNLKYTGSKV